MSRILDKYRKEAHDYFNHDYRLHLPWRAAILEAIFKPKAHVPGKDNMTHLHPDIDKLHLPPGVYIADWRKYQVTDHPALMKFQKRCHDAGLHDPWLRNFAYTFYPNYLTGRSRFAVVMNQSGWGFVAALILFASHKTLVYFFPPDYKHSPWHDEHGDGHH